MSNLRNYISYSIDFVLMIKFLFIVSQNLDFFLFSFLLSGGGINLWLGSSGEGNDMIVGATRSSKFLHGSSEFVLTYEDKDGDWMLVGDVPWGYV